MTALGIIGGSCKTVDFLKGGIPVLKSDFRSREVKTLKLPSEFNNFFEHFCNVTRNSGSCTIGELNRADFQLLEYCLLWKNYSDDEDDKDDDMEVEHGKWISL